MNKNQHPTFRVIQGGLPDNHVEPSHLSEEELRASPIGQMLRASFDNTKPAGDDFDYWDTMHGYGGDNTHKSPSQEQPHPKPPEDDNDFFDNVPV